MLLCNAQCLRSINYYLANCTNSVMYNPRTYKLGMPRAKLRTLINSMRPIDLYLRHLTSPSLVQIMACHYLNEFRIIFNLTFANIFQRNFNQNATFMEKHAYENVVCKMAGILARPQCVKQRIPECVCFDPVMTPSNGNNFRITGHLCGEFTGHLEIPLTKASDAELWGFLWSVAE